MPLSLVPAFFAISLVLVGKYPFWKNSSLAAEIILSSKLFVCCPSSILYLAIWAIVSIAIVKIFSFLMKLSAPSTPTRTYFYDSSTTIIKSQIFFDSLVGNITFEFSPVLQQAKPAVARRVQRSPQPTEAAGSLLGAACAARTLPYTARLRDRRYPECATDAGREAGASLSA